MRESREDADKRQHINDIALGFYFVRNKAFEGTRRVLGQEVSLLYIGFISTRNGAVLTSDAALAARLKKVALY